MKKIDNINKIISGNYSALYLTKTKNILKKNKVKNKTIMRFCHFNKTPIYVCGIKHVVQVLKNLKHKPFRVYGVKDGQLVKAGQPILIIEGDYSAFAEYESFIDGILARESSVCTNCKKILSLIKSNQLIYMGDRGDLYLAHAYDGYAAYKAGIKIFTTRAHVELIDKQSEVKVVGTIPHALIQQFNGNLSKALWAYHKTYPKEKLSALVDYHNDVVNEIKNIDKGLKPLIKSIRIDTSKNLLDKSLSNKKDNGVSTHLISKARKALDANGMKHVKIVVSSGFNYETIKQFKAKKAPVDFYGIGGSLLKVNVNITGDLVYLNNKPQAKAGRKLGIPVKNIKKLNIYI